MEMGIKMEQEDVDWIHPASWGEEQLAVCCEGGRWRETEGRGVSSGQLVQVVRAAVRREGSVSSG
jgi:hypothetical protein